MFMSLAKVFATWQFIVNLKIIVVVAALIDTGPPGSLQVPSQSGPAHWLPNTKLGFWNTYLLIIKINNFIDSRAWAAADIFVRGGKGQRDWKKNGRFCYMLISVKCIYV